MAQIPTYSATLGGLPIGGGRRADVSDDPTAATLHAAAGQAAKTSEALITNIEENESRKALVDVSEIRTKYAKAMDDAATSGGDLDKLKQQLTDDLAKVGEGFQTKKGAESLRMYSANTNLMFDEQSNHIALQRAWAQAKVDGQQFLKNASTLIQQDPAYLAVAEKDAESFVDTFSKLRSDQRLTLKDDMKKSLNMAAAIGAVRADPTEGKKRLDAGEWNLTLEQREHAKKEAEHYENVLRASEERERVRVERERHDDANTARDGYTQKILKGDHGNTLYNEIVRDPAFAHYPQYREHLAVFMREDAKRLANQEKASNPVVRKDLWLDIHAAEGDPRKVYNGDKVFAAVAAGNLNTTDANSLLQDVANQRDENGRTVGQKLNVLTSVVGRALSQDPQFTAQPALVAEIQNDYIDRVQQKIKSLRESGDKLPSRVFEVGDKDYVGSRAFIQGAIDAAKERQRAALPQVVDLRKTPEAATGIPVGTSFTDPNGVQRKMTQKLLDELKKQGPASALPPKTPEYEGYIKTKPRSTSVEIDAPTRSAARKLQGQTFESRDAALAALKAIYE